MIVFCAARFIDSRSVAYMMHATSGAGFVVSSVYGACLHQDLSNLASFFPEKSSC